MEIAKLSLKDRLHYLIALLCTAVSSMAGMLAVHQMRMLVLTWVAYAGYTNLGRRFANMATWVVLGIAWAIYVFAITPYHHIGVSEARAQRLRVEQGFASHTRSKNPLMRFLWQQDLHITAKRFAITLAIPLSLSMIAYLVMTLMMQAMLP